MQPRRNGASSKKLNPMQRAFVQELLADEKFNATAAARRAGYKQPTQASNKLLSKREVQAILGKEIRLRIERMQLKADDVLEHLRTALFLDPLQLFDEDDDGNLTVKSLEEIPEAVRRCITKLKVKVRQTKRSTDTTFELELMSKDAALTNAMKHLGLISADNLNFVNVGPVDLREVLDRVEEERANVIDGAVIKRLAEGG